MNPVTAAFAIAALSLAAAAGAVSPPGAARGAEVAVAQQSAQPVPAEGTKKRTRVATDVSSFEMLTPEQLAKHTTVAAGTRGLVPPPPEPIAPYLGRSLSTRPTLIWEARDTDVQVVLEDEGGAEVLRRPVAGNRLDWGDAPPLETGRTYTWRVEKGRGHSSTAGLVVLSGEERESLETALAAIQGDGLEAQLERARTLAWRGVWYDSVALYGRLIEAHPGRADLYRERAAVLGTVLRGSDAAAADLEEAARLEQP